MFYRLRSRLNYALFHRLTGKMALTRPMPSNPAAACEVVTMLGKRDLYLYLAAIKSLLRFYDDLSVMVYSDGTLDRESCDLLTHHVPDCRVVSTAEADRRARRDLAGHPLLLRFRDVDCSWQRLIDSAIWGRTEKRFIFDSDILVLKRPAELIAWIEQGDRPFLLGDPVRPTRPTAAAPSHVQDVFKLRLEEMGQGLGVEPRFLDGGCAGFYGTAHELELDAVNDLLGVALDLGVPMDQWGGEQCAVIFLLSIHGGRFLPTEGYFNFWPPACLPKLEHAEAVHFLGTNRFYRLIYPRLARAVARSLALR